MNDLKKPAVNKKQKINAIYRRHPFPEGTPSEREKQAFIQTVRNNKRKNIIDCHIPE